MTIDDNKENIMSNLNKQKMVGWYNPGQLLKTAGDVVVSTIFGRHADQRLIEALFDDPRGQNPTDLFEDYSKNHNELWLDYVADLGDGWNSTYGVAYQLSQPKLSFTYDNERYDTEQGQVLIFGGDEVYPTASRLAYKERTFHPYDCAFSGNGRLRPDLYALPGNHDWYDSLVAFTRYFIDKDDIAKFRTKQRRSYFAIKLPHGWWLLAADTQLGSYIDGPQVIFFEEIAKKHIKDGDSIILCNAEPTWIYEAVYHKDDPNADNRNLDYLEKTILKGKSVRVFLAGDLHHYRRHASDDCTQKITAGGGGAFLHPTHCWEDKLKRITEAEVANVLPKTFFHQASWPLPTVSRLLTFRNLLFPVLNWKFGIAPAFLYLMTCWSVMADVGNDTTISQAVSTISKQFLLTPFPAFWATFLFLGFWLFTDTHARLYRLAAGTVHGIMHLVATFFIGWGSTFFTVHMMELTFRGFWQLVVSGAIIIVAGWLVGSLILGLYLLISLNVFGRHMNEAFSSLRIEDWKHFLRLHINAHGQLTIYPIGIRRVPRSWVTNPSSASGPRFVPNDPRAAQPELIEAPITVPQLTKCVAPPAG